MTSFAVYRCYAGFFIGLLILGAQVSGAAASDSCMPVLMAPVSADVTTERIADILAADRRGEQVVLEGYIVREVNFETVLFEDVSGQIEVVIEEDNSLPERAVARGWALRLRGEVDSGYQGVPVITFEDVEILDEKPRQIITASVEEEPALRTDVSLPVAEPVADVRHQPAQDGAGSMTVAGILAAPEIGRTVELYGSLVRKVNFETLLFEDRTGRIEIIIPEEYPFVGGAEDWGRSLRIEGKVDGGYEGRVVIELTSLEFQDDRSDPVVKTMRSACSAANASPMSVGTVLNNGLDGQVVLLRGRILLFVDRYNFVLNDGRNAIVIDYKNLESQADIEENNSVIVVGKIKNTIIDDDHKKRKYISASCIE